MSFTIVAMDKDGENIHAITDKRVGSAASLNGQLVNWHFQHDNDLKIHKIINNVYLTGGAISSMGDDLLNCLLSFNSSLPSEIINSAKNFDRLITPPWGNSTHNPAIIFGIYDDGNLFLWKGDRDGTESLTFPDGNHIIELSGGLNDTCAKAIKYFCGLFKDYSRGIADQVLQLAMRETLAYAASIDYVISPTFDFVSINKTEKSSKELFSKLTLTSDSGQRIVITGADNTQVFYNSDDIEVFRLDDNIDVSQANGSASGGIRANTPGGDTSYLTGNGVFANGSGLQFLSAITGHKTNASVVGLLRYRNSDDSGGLSAAVVGIDQSPDDTNTSHSYAGYFNGTTQLGAPALGVFMTSTSPGQIPNYFYGFALMTMNGLLPYKPAPGQMIIVRNVAASPILLYGNAYPIIDSINASLTNQQIAIGKSKTYVFSVEYASWFEIVQ